MTAARNSVTGTPATASAEPGRRRGSRAPLTDRGEVLGTVLRTRDGVRPVYVSVGHAIDLATADNRSTYVAVSNTLIGIVLLASGSFGLLADALGPRAVIFAFSPRPLGVNAYA